MIPEGGLGEVGDTVKSETPTNNYSLLLGFS